MFRDTIRATFIAGKGGDGHVSFGMDRKPSGGIGGDGGSIYLEGTANRYDLSYINTDQIFKAGNGDKGGKNNLTGRNGDDLIIPVPIATKVYDMEGNLKLTIDKLGEKKLFLKGGQGGLGNQFFRKSHGRDLYRFTNGKVGEEIYAKFQLELQADIIFIGLPNAGKSSILKEITNADAKVGAYPFTTLIPQLGRLDDMVLMDLPGLIEGTATGKGVGTKFLKHTRSSRIIAHFISLESPDLQDGYEEIREELKNLGENLYDKKEIIVLTKSDTVSPQKAEEAVKFFKKKKLPTILVSIYDDNSLEKLKDYFNSELKKLN
jgi:GTP-binding protein